MPEPWPPAYTWLDASSSDDDNDDDDVPTSPCVYGPVPLGRCAKDTLAKLKERTPKHVLEVRDYWYDLETCKYKNKMPKSVDVNDLFRNVGILITMPDSVAEDIIDRAEGKGDVTKKVTSQMVKMMIDRLSGKSKKYMYNVGVFWWILKLKKSGHNEGRVRMFKDLGLLMQTPDQEVHEVMWLLEEMMKKAEIEHEEAQRRQGAIPSIARRAQKYPQGVRHRDGHPKPLTTLSISDQGKKRPAEDEGGESQPARKKTGGKYWRYIPKPGQWKCAVCGYWSFQPKCERKDKDGNKACTGSRESRIGTHGRLSCL